MPCYTVQLMSIEFKAQNWGTLEAALKALGWTFTKSGNKVVTTPKGHWRQITIDLTAQKAEVVADQQAQLNELKRAYSWQAIQTAARVRGWTAKTTNTQNTVGTITKW